MNGLMKDGRGYGKEWGSRAFLVGGVAAHGMYGHMSTPTLLESSRPVRSGKREGGGCAGQHHAEASCKHAAGKEPSQPPAKQSEEDKAGASPKALGTSSYTPVSCKAARGST